MTRRPTTARRGGVLVALMLAGLGGACTTVRDPAYDTAYTAARAGDTYCQEAASRLARTRGYASRDC